MATRREFLERSTALAAAAVSSSSLFGQTTQNTATAKRGDFTNPGQQNSALVNINPNSNMPPPTDHGTVPPIWYSFDLTHRRIQAGGSGYVLFPRRSPRHTPTCPSRRSMRFRTKLLPLCE